MPQVQRTQREQRRLRKEARQMMRLRDKYGFLRTRAEGRFARAGHEGIRIRMSRATIGELYNHARLTEALVTFRFGNPIILRAERLDEISSSITHMRKATDTLWETLRFEARKYAKKRKPVRHPVWKGRR